ncbi:MAG: hypothetical protein LBV11_08025 [Bacillus cereus]|jgi:hypothetical protein|nr:hypothetical protein [Bacillus cereus]
MLLIDPKNWHDFKDSNKKHPVYEPIIAFAETWANLIESRMKKQQKKLSEVAMDAVHDVFAVQSMFNGHMMEIAISILAEHWIYGKELQKWHSSLRR